MKLSEKIHEVSKLRERADEIHAHHEDLRRKGQTSVVSSKELSSYQGILEDAENLRNAASSRLKALALWIAVTVARISLDNYIESFQDS